MQMTVMPDMDISMVFACSQYSVDLSNIYRSRGGESEGMGLVCGEVESCKIIFLGWHFLFTHSNTCCRMKRLTIIHSITDRQTNDGIMPRVYCIACSSTIA